MNRRHRPGPVARWFLRAPTVLYRHDLGWLLGGRFLMLTHRGRRSGRVYRTPLEVIGADPDRDEVLVLAGRGAGADWWRNVQAAPAVELTLGRRRYRPQHRMLDPHDAAAVLERYERRNRWVAPLVRRILSWLVGWRYDGSAPARTRLVQELPVIAFSPAAGAHQPTEGLPS